MDRERLTHLQQPNAESSHAGVSRERLTHLQQLEAESIHIIREVAAEFENPVMMYSIGKDSSVMLHLARKAFYPGKIPFPLLHVDTDWKFKEMIKFRDETAKKYGLDLIVHKNPEGLAMGINPFVHGSGKHTDIMKTEGLKQALNKYGFDAAFGGARRDEEKSRAKERVYSFRDKSHRWDPKNQRPGAVARLQQPGQQGGEHPGVPALQLDRAGYLAIHLSREHRHSAALLRGHASGGGAQRHQDHGG